MASYARITLIGNVGRDPEIKDLGQNKVAEFSMAVSGKTTGKNAAEWTNWYRISVWGKQADVAQQYIKKGTQLFVEGRLQLREYTKADGTQGTSLEVNASDFQLLGGREGGQEGGGQGNGGGYQSQGGNQGGEYQQSGGGGSQRSAEPVRQAEPIGPDDDLPF
jgi:single-strand DNA-binding protein